MLVYDTSIPFTLYTASTRDYEHLTMPATFTSTVSQVCGIMIQTKTDSIYENNEVFGVSLSVVDASANPRIRLGTNIIIRIIDRQRKKTLLINVIHKLSIILLILQELQYR